ncbi:MAG: uracil-DNA glycosylase [Pirellulaceae bacterium]|nr:uracil-DNA glycosylase [Pirellulaceae bacterium]
MPQKAVGTKAYRLTPLERVKFVILGQDPYHGAGQAHGLSFSVPESVRTPPSLANIFKELKADLGEEIPKSGNLSAWATQGGLLLNTVLTVRSAEANSHRKQGWERFTDATIRLVNQKCENVAFVLWGAPARKKTNLINGDRHLIIEAPHPSPLSAYRGFLGSRPFSKINQYRRRHGLPEIDWCEA